MRDALVVKKSNEYCCERKEMGKRKSSRTKQIFKRAPDLSVYLFKFIESKSGGFNV